MPFETVTESLQARASDDGSALAFQFHDGGGKPVTSLTYAQLDRRARSLAADLVEQGAGGQRVVLSYSPGLEFIAAFFACQYAGAVPVPAYPPDPQRLEQSLPRLAHVIADSGAGVVLTDRRLLTALDRLGWRGQAASWLGGMRWPVGNGIGGNWRARLQRLGRVRRVASPDVQWIATDGIPTRQADDFTPASASGTTLAYLQYTSGSTSQPRGVCLTHANVLANVIMAARLVGLDRQSVGAGWVPLHHDLGLVCHVIAAVVIGYPSHLMSPQDFLRRPMSWLDLISRHRATHAGAPNFAYQLCVRKSDPASRQTLDLRSWRVAGNGGEPVRPATLERFCRTFADQGFSPSAFMPTYGSAEATLFIASGKPPGRSANILHVESAALAKHRIVRCAPDQSGAVGLVGHGRTGAGHELRIVEPGTRDPVPDGHIGEIFFRGPSVAAGYHGTQPDVWPFGLTLSTTPLLNAAAEPRFLCTGDLGCIQDGELFITGRFKDLLIIQGRNLYPTDLEASVERSHAALRAGCSAVFSLPGVETERVIVVAELARRRTARGARTSEIFRCIMRSVAAGHDVRVDRVVLIAPRSLPKTSSGKVQRGLTRELLQQGALPVEADYHRNRQNEVSAVPADSDDSYSVTVAEVTALLSDVVRRTIRADDALSMAGLDSLALIEVIETIRLRSGASLDAEEFFQAVTPGGLAQLIESHGRFHGWRPLDVSAVEDARRRARLTGLQSASTTQRFFWDMHQLLPGSYRSHVLLELKGVLDVRELELAWRELLEDNAVLRASYVLQAKRLKFSIDDACLMPIEWLDAQDWSRKHLMQAVSTEVQRPFDLSSPPLARCRVYRRTDTGFILQMVGHHIAVDLWSFSRLIDDLLRSHAAIAGGVSVHRRFMPLPVEMIDRDKPPIPPVPVRKLASMPVTYSLLYSTPVLQLPAMSVLRLHDRARQWQVSLSAVLLSAFVSELADSRGRRELSVALPVTTRTAATIDVSGPMMHFLPVTVQRLPDDAPKVQVQHVARSLADALEHRLQAFEYASDGSDFPDVHFNFYDFERLRMSDRLKQLHLGRSVTVGELGVSMQSASAIETVSPVAVGMMAVLINDEMMLWLNGRPDVMTRKEADRLMAGIVRNLDVSAAHAGESTRA